ncbi:MAG: WavE lipopolysaccharide synthesis family protein [Candidatus Gastranaerophilales bacterium]|nr:WavE lipopolysaccharide synthesis family protein [Candidatus Gastranaerophilales bacterium]
MAKIKSSEISIVVQGPVFDTPELSTKKTVESLRKQMPDAEIILSTWKNSKTNNIDYDILVESLCPESYIRNDVLKIYNNVNKQIVSSREGIKKANRKYVLKFRSDTIIAGTKFLNYFGKYKKRCDEWKIFKERILVCSIYTRNPNRLRPYPYHPSDLVQFGLKEDIEHLFDIPLEPDPEYTRWFDNHPRPDLDYYPDEKTRYVPEQYIWHKLLEKHGKLNFEQNWDVSGDNIRNTEISFANNLVILEPFQYCLKFPKLEPVRLVDWVSVYGYREWQGLYKKYCNPKAIKHIDVELLMKNFLLKTGIINGVPSHVLQTRRQCNAMAEDIKLLKAELEQIKNKLD